VNILFDAKASTIAELLVGGGGNMTNQNPRGEMTMKPFRNRELGVSLLYILAIVTVIEVSGCKPSPPPAFKVSGSNVVRGYLAAAVGRSEKAESGGIYSSTIEGKDIYLPGATVYLEDPQTGNRSDSARTDLSGRFTLYAPYNGRYRICWESKVYESGCTAAFVSAGSEPQFVSTLNIKVPPKQGYVAIIGRVTAADGSIPRTFDPLVNINAFATVGLDDERGNRITDVYVNNFGDYLVPYVPVKQKINLIASIESAKFAQEVWREAQIEAAPLHQVNLKFENNRPRLDPLVAFDSVNKSRVQNATPGSKVNIDAKARDNDGDPIEFAWFLDPSEGQLSQTTGSTVEWKLPATPGRYSVTVFAYDNKGGYDKAMLSVLADGRGVPFTGVVVEPGGAPVAGASIEIARNKRVRTDTNGRFLAKAREANRYVLNVRKEGYALNSQVYDRAVTGGRWILRPAQLVTIDPTQNAAIAHERTERDCPGPDSLRAGFGAAGDSLKIPQWQDGKGNVIDPPQRERKPVVLPRDLKLPKCGPGVRVEIPANSILDPSGNPATAPIKVTIATVDLLSPQQMPGDYSAVGSGGVARMDSFGAGYLDLPPGFRLKSGATARVTIPVDRSRLSGVLPATVPLLSYSELRGLWEEEDTLTLSTIGGLKVYQGTVRHFSAFNADTLFTNNACLRVFSSTLPGQYELEVDAPNVDGTRHIKKELIDNKSSTEHVLYNLVPNRDLKLAPMTQAPNSQLLGYYIVNAGPVTPFIGNVGVGNKPDGPPYIDCKNFVVLKVGSAPGSPFGGEFLHGLGFIDGANLGFDELTAAAPTGNTQRDAIVKASEDYYRSVDPTDGRKTFAQFKSKNGFDESPSVSVPGEVVAQYANSGDLGFGRDMHCLKKTNGDVACYVTNYGDGYKNTGGSGLEGGGGTDDQEDANAAGQRSNSAEVATVAMEYSPIENDPVGDKVVKFFVYKKGLASISANLDGRGERPVPQLCMICHGGQIPQQAGGVPAFGTAAQVKLGSRFLPFDHRLFTFPTNPASLSKANQEASIKNLNEQIVNAAPPAPTDDPIREVVSGLYNNGASATQILNFTVPGWVNGASAAAPNQADFYQKVIAPACRVCHTAQPFSQMQFNTSNSFLHLAQFPQGTVGGVTNGLMLGTAQSRVCGDYTMPHALRTHDIFWGVYTSIDPTIAGISMPTEFQNFGNGVGVSTWKAGLCTSFISNLVSKPSQFYQHTIQPIFNGKCVGCHVVKGPGAFMPLTEGVSYDELVPPPPPPDARVVPGNDNPAAAGNTLLLRTTETTPGTDRMPPNCFRAPEPPIGLPCLSQVDIDKIKAWIRNGAN
jgi:Carboxypeptidase regulatory-like domain